MSARALLRMLPAAVALVAVALVAPPAVGAQALDARLADARFSAESRAALGTLIDSARMAGLPTEPLVQKALEGASRQAPPPRIVAAVRSLGERLRTAREALGASSTDAELVAGASALYVGVGAPALERLRRAQRTDVSLALVVLADIVERGVPQDAASRALISLAGAGVRDDGLQAFRSSVLADIQTGTAPALAAAARTRGTLEGTGRPRSP